MYKRRHTGGLSPDFMTINIVGFLAYSIFTYASFYVPAVSKSYMTRLGSAPQVDMADVLFASHGAVMCSVMIGQMLMYPPQTAPKKWIAVSSGIVLMMVVIGLSGSIMGYVQWYDFLRFSGMVKVVSTLFKHFPQVLLNRARQSTIGWSFSMVLLDVLGGSFSIAQQVVRCLRLQSWAPFTANLPKTFLAMESLMFDAFFILQHVMWYTDREDIDQANGRVESREALGEGGWETWKNTIDQNARQPLLTA